MSVQRPPSMTNSRWIWPFEIIEQIGEGGMGVVYRARYVVNGRQVALKMLPGDVSDKTALARFERELEVLKTLKHPNIVRCFGGVCEDKRRFYAMELLEGGSLEDQLRAKGKFAWEQVIYFGLQMCAALECSHQKGVVHRDVKPSNFLLTPDGQLKLSDFGLASVMAARKITAAGKTAGTFLYMAPEQIRGQEVTPKTDLYALGCVLYELVTGEVPFLGETPGATLHLHCYSQPARPTEKALDCPVQLERIILRLMEKDPADRPASALVVAKELRAVNQTITVVTKASPLQERLAKEAEQRKTPSQPQKKTAVAGPAAGRPSGWIFWGVLAALALSLSGNIAQVAAPHGDAEWRRLWLEALESPQADVRVAAARAFGKNAASNPACIPSLLTAIDDVDAQVRLAAIQGLSLAGEPAANAVPRLLKAYRTDPTPDVRDAAGAAINKIQNAGADSPFPWLGLLLASLLAFGATAGVYVWYRSTEESARPKAGT